MGSLKIKINFLLLTLIIFSCYKPYYPEDLDDDENIIVVQGLLTNNPGPCYIQLSWATAFLGDEINPVEGAQVVLSDDKGNSEILREQYNGNYYTAKQSIKGTIGNTYTLQIILPDGTIYESLPSTMKPAPSYDTIYAEIGKKRTISQDYSGDLMFHDDDGLYAYIDMRLSNDEQRFFRFKSASYVQYSYETKPNSSIPVTSYCIGYRRSHFLPNIKSTVLYNNEYIIKKYEMDFLTYIYNLTAATDTTSAHRPDGWIMRNTLYSIDANAYSYYKSYIDQMGDDERIFDPAPTQITGNIKCISDSAKIALGLFEVASTNNLYVAFYWERGMSEYIMKELSEETWMNSDICNAINVPYYWIIF